MLELEVSLPIFNLNVGKCLLLPHPSYLRIGHRHLRDQRQWAVNHTIFPCWYIWQPSPPFIPAGHSKPRYILNLSSFNTRRTNNGVSASPEGRIVFCDRVETHRSSCGTSCYLGPTVLGILCRI